MRTCLRDWLPLIRISSPCILITSILILFISFALVVLLLVFGVSIPLGSIRIPIISPSIPLLNIRIRLPSPLAHSCTAWEHRGNRLTVIPCIIDFFNMCERFCEATLSFVCFHHSAWVLNPAPIHA